MYEAQAMFNPSRIITYNILLDSQLVKGYTKKNNSPKYMMKVDWGKLMITYNQFSQRFIDWIVDFNSSITFRSYWMESL